jgi:hypothetical protein
VPLQWATTQNNLGAVLTTLGERESGTKRLEEAAASFSNVLQVDPTDERAYLRANFLYHDKLFAFALKVRAGGNKCNGSSDVRIQGPKIRYFVLGTMSSEASATEAVQGRRRGGWTTVIKL